MSETTRPATPTSIQIVSPSEPDPSGDASALTAALPNARVAPAHTPVGADASGPPTLASVTASLAGLVQGHRRGDTAFVKAARIVNFLPANLKGPQHLQHIANAIESDPQGVQALLHFKSDQGDPARRAAFRTELAGILAAHGPDAADRRKAELVNLCRLADKLKGLAPGSGNAARQEAWRIIDRLPPDAKGGEKLQRLLDHASAGGLISANPVKALLRFSGEQGRNADVRTAARSELLAMLAAGETLAAASARKVEMVQPRHAAPPTMLPVTTVRDEAAFQDTTVRGTPAQPLALDFIGKDSRQIMLRALGRGGYDDQAMRTASTATRLGATRGDYLLTDSLNPCQPVIVFWKDENGGQKATLFHFNGPYDKDDILERLNSIDPMMKDDMRVDSITHVERYHHKTLLSFNEHYRKQLSLLAGQFGAPFNIIPRQAKTDVMGIAVDVCNAKIVSMDQETFSSVYFQQPVNVPWPTRDQNDEAWQMD